jgi:hypothetical protein
LTPDLIRGKPIIEDAQLMGFAFGSTPPTTVLLVIPAKAGIQ